MKKLSLKFSLAAVSFSALVLGGAAYAHNHGRMGDADITRAQAQEKSATMFAKMDANGDGLINQADSDARLASHFDAMDADKNGSISREEFAAGHAAMREGRGTGEGQRMGRHGGMKMGGHRQKMMQMADKDGDGSVSAAEFTEAHLAMFDKADANNDGTVTAAERKAAMMAMHSEWKAKAADAEASDAQ